MKFSTRDLLLVTVIVALAMAWWVDHRRMARRDYEHYRDAAYLAEVLGDPRLTDNRNEIAHRLLVKYGWASP